MWLERPNSIANGVFIAVRCDVAPPISSPGSSISDPYARIPKCPAAGACSAPRHGPASKHDPQAKAANRDNVVRIAILHSIQWGPLELFRRSANRSNRLGMGGRGKA